jgi:hypothetical protein
MTVVPHISSARLISRSTQQQDEERETPESTRKIREEDCHCGPGLARPNSVRILFLRSAQRWARTLKELYICNLVKPSNFDAAHYNAWDC